MQVAAEGVGVLRTEVGLDAAQGLVHHGEVERDKFRTHGDCK
jgi:hypothetical protein